VKGQVFRFESMSVVVDLEIQPTFGGARSVEPRLESHGYRAVMPLFMVPLDVSLMLFVEFFLLILVDDVWSAVR
jgi:hypothetical protein